MSLLFINLEMTVLCKTVSIGLNYVCDDLLRSVFRYPREGS